MTRALFLDRDGVINVDKGYVCRIHDFEFVPGIFDLCATAQQLGFAPIVVTNQAGIGRGYYTEADFARLTAWMIERFRERNVHIRRVYHCPYHPTGGIGDYKRESDDRKPNPGMLLRARTDFALDLAQSVLVGDKATDVEAGRRAGVPFNLMLAQQSNATPARATLQFPDLAAIAVWLRGHATPR